MQNFNRQRRTTQKSKGNKQIHTTATLTTGEPILSVIEFRPVRINLSPQGHNCTASRCVCVCVYVHSTLLCMCVHVCVSVLRVNHLFITAAVMTTVVECCRKCAASASSEGQNEGSNLCPIGRVAAGREGRREVHFLITITRIGK